MFVATIKIVHRPVTLPLVGCCRTLRIEVVGVPGTSTKRQPFPLP